MPKIYMYRFIKVNRKLRFLDPCPKHQATNGTTTRASGFAPTATRTGNSSPTVFQIVDGRLLLQYSGDASGAFNRDKDGNPKKADANWSKLDKSESK